MTVFRENLICAALPSRNFSGIDMIVQLSQKIADECCKQWGHVHSSAIAVENICYRCGVTISNKESV